MVSRHPPKFGVHEHCGSRDLFLVVEEEIPHVHDMSCILLLKKA